VRVLLSTFEGVFLPGRSAQDAIRNPYYAGQVVDGTTLSKRQAAFRNLKAYVQELGLDDLDNVTMVGDDIAKYSNGTSAEELKIGASGDRWTEVIRNKFLDRYLSEDVGNGLAGNGTEAQAVAHNWFGRGLIQMTHKAPFAMFGQYIQDHHRELVAAEAGKTIKQTLLDNTKLIVDIENDPNSRMLAALSGAWYWAEYTNTSHGPSINTQADLLNFDPDNPTEQAKFNAVSQKVNGNDQLVKRWKIYKDEVTPKILIGGNPYENMADALKRLGIATTGAQGYETQFGISLAKRTVVEIGGSSHQLMANMSASILPYADKIPALLVQAQQALNLKEGEFTMWISDMPIQQIEPPAIYLAANTQAGQTGGRL